MKKIHPLIVLLVVSLLTTGLMVSGCGPGQSVEPTLASPSPLTEPLPLTLGYIEGESGRSETPAVFVGLGTALVIEISDTEYDNIRRMKSYKEKISYPAGETIELEFRDIIYNELQQVAGYAALINGQVTNGPALQEFEGNKSQIKGWAFSPGGYSLPCAETRSRLGYARINGKFQVARQVIICAGPDETYVIQSFEYTHNIHGDLTGLLIEISPAFPATEIAILSESPATISIPACETTGDNTFLCASGESGERIGGGKNLILTPQDGQFTLEPWGNNRFNAAIELEQGSWYLEFAAPRGQTWNAGVYENAKGMPGRGDNPTLNVSGNSVGCDVGESFGKFEILELEYDSSSQQIKRLATNFEYHCDGSPAALWGALRYNSNSPINTSISSAPTPVASSGPQPGHWEGDNPAVSFDLTADMKIINFKMVTSFVGSSCGYTVPEIVIEPDNTFSIDATTDTFVGGIRGKFDSGTTASGTQGIVLCGNMAGLDMNVPAWRAKWSSPELTGSGNETVEQAATPTPGLSADTLTPVLPLATPVPTILAPPVSPTPIVYIVQKGDSLVSIAFTFGVDVATLKQINNLTDNDMLTVGQTLIIEK